MIVRKTIVDGKFTGSKYNANYRVGYKTGDNPFYQIYTMDLDTRKFTRVSPGVGKTTCATSAAIHAADQGRHVLIVSTDPAHSLGDALATRLSAHPKKIAGVRGSLHAVELDADRALDRWMNERKKSFELIAEHGTYLDTEDIERLLGTMQGPVLLPR